MINKMLCSSALALVLYAAPAFAQEASDAGASDEIIVTANKRAQNLQDVPVAVTPISQDKLTSQNVVSIGELTTIAPSLSFVPAPSPATTMFVVRGIGTFAFNDALEQSVGLVLDGVPLARLVGSVSDAVDMGQVQLLRGPQGTLFGKNATAGAIALDYREPTYETTFDGRAFIGSYSEHRFQGTFNLPLIDDKLAIRLTGWNFTRNGYIDAPYQPDGNIGSLHNYGGRLKVRINPTDNWQINLTGEFRRDRNDGSIQTIRGVIVNQGPGTVYAPASGTGGFNEPISDIERLIWGIDKKGGMVTGVNNLLTLKDEEEFYLAKQQRLVAKSVWDLGFASLTGIGGYVNTRSNALQETDYSDSRVVLNPGDPGFLYNGVLLPGQSPTAPQRIVNPGLTHYFNHISQWTGELRLSNGNDEAFKYTVGLFYYNVDVSANQNARQPVATRRDGTAPATTGSVSNLTINTKNYAAFTDLSYDIGPVTVFAGGRYSHEKTGGTFFRGALTDPVLLSTTTPGLVIPPQATVSNGGVFGPIASSVAINDFSWRFGAQWHVTDDIMLYASGSKAYKGPGLNFGPTLTAAQFALNKAIVGKETAHNWEIGARTQWFDRQLTLNLTAFYSPFTNFQVTAVLPTTPTSFTTVNAPEILAKGVELEFAFTPRGDLEGFRVDGNLTYNDTKYKDFTTAPCYTGQAISPTPTTTPGVCAFNPTANATVQSVNGLRAVGAPAWVANLTGGYEHDLGSIRLFGQVHYYYTSKIQYGLNDNPDSIQKGYSTIDLSMGFGAADKKWTITGYIRNLTDQRFATRISFANPTINQSIPFTALRSGGVSLDVAF